MHVYKIVQGNEFDKNNIFHTKLVMHGYRLLNVILTEIHCLTRRYFFVFWDRSDRRNNVILAVFDYVFSFSHSVFLPLGVSMGSIVVFIFGSLSTRNIADDDINDDEMFLSCSIIHLSVHCTFVHFDSVTLPPDIWMILVDMIMIL